MTTPHAGQLTTAAAPGARAKERGFTLIELLVGATLMAVGLLSISGMFVLVYAQATRSGRTTMGLAAARQVFEEARQIPFDNIDNLNNFDSDNSGTQPGSGRERDVARSFRYALAGEGVGWTFTTDERQRWDFMASDGRALRARGRITVTAQGTDMWRVTIRVDVPGYPVPISLSTLISRNSA